LKLFNDLMTEPFEQNENMDVVTAEVERRWKVVMEIARKDVD
jgi:hypothetical protein